MRLTIHRGTHEIGGSCLELCSNSGCTRIIIDVGMPLVTPDRTSFDWSSYKGFPQVELLEQRVLPAVKGFYSWQKPSISAVILSHAHQDHYGFIRFIHLRSCAHEPRYSGETVCQYQVQLSRDIKEALYTRRSILLSDHNWHDLVYDDLKEWVRSNRESLDSGAELKGKMFSYRRNSSTDKYQVRLRGHVKEALYAP